MRIILLSLICARISVAEAPATIEATVRSLAKVGITVSANVGSLDGDTEVVSPKSSTSRKEPYHLVDFEFQIKISDLNAQGIYLHLQGYSGGQCILSVPVEGYANRIRDGDDEWSVGGSILLPKGHVKDYKLLIKSKRGIDPNSYLLP